MGRHASCFHHVDSQSREADNALYPALLLCIACRCRMLSSGMSCPPVAMPAGTVPNRAMIHSQLVSALVFAVTSMAAGNDACAQCTTSWLPGERLADVNGPVRTIGMWDPDGAGPAGARIVLAGDFSLAGNIPAANIAAWDPAADTWSTMGSGVGDVRCMVSMPNGDLIVGGDFTSAGGVPANRIARWNGTAWSALGAGANGGVRALVAMPNGDVAVAGQFNAAGGTVADRVARWNGTSWSTFGSGFSSPFDFVTALAVRPNGDLVAGGRFSRAGGVPVSNVASWNGSVWSSMGAVTIPGAVLALATLTNGDVVAAGAFSTVIRWNGFSWLTMPGAPSGVVALAAMPNGDVVAGGDFLNGAHGVARWNGATWSLLGAGIGGTSAVAALPNGDVLANRTVGYFFSGHTWRWDGTKWSGLSSGSSGAVLLGSLPNGDLVAELLVAGGQSGNLVARWNGATWSALGPATDSRVEAFTVMPNGDPVAGFSANSGTVASYFVARWNGSTWLPLGGAMDNAILALTAMPNGDIVAGGRFTVAGGVAANRVARWSGSTWSALGAGVDDVVSDLAIMPNGDVVAAGSFAVAGGVVAPGIARWDGASWSALGSGLNGYVTALGLSPDGDLLVGGGFSNAGGVAADGIARWDGTSWSALGTGVGSGGAFGVMALTFLPNGDLLAAGGFPTAGGVPVNSIARWNGTSWSALGSGVDDFVIALTTLPNGDVVAGGNFAVAGGQVSAYIARLTTTCPATAVGSGAGCIGTVGPVTLAANSLPWIGTTYRATATGFGPTSIAIWAAGFPLSMPLSLVHPAAAPGCSLLTTFDVEFELQIPIAGASINTITIPANPSLVGVTFAKQAAEVTLSPTLDIVTLASSNALHLTVGSF